MTAPAPGPAPSQPTSAVEPDLGARARALRADAEKFTSTDLHTWYDAVTGLDVSQVGQSADLIIRRWMELHQAQTGLTGAATAQDQQGAMAQAFLSLSFAPTVDAKPEIDAATQAVDVGRRTIGNVVTLQDFDGKPVLAHYQTFPVPADPTPYVDNERNKATDVITVVSQLITVLAMAAGKLDEAQSDQVAALFAQLRDQMSFNFAMAALAKWKLDKTVWTAFGHGRSALLATHKQLQEQAFVNRDGRDADATPEILEQMQKDADELDTAVNHKWIVSDDHVNRILDHYKTERQRELFFKLLERRNLIDAVLHRADTKHVEGELHETKGFEKREYNASFNTSRSFGEQAEYVGAEAAKQAPGALCHFASGVFKGLSKIPVIGGVFGRSASAFSDLGDEADLATGAWRDKSALAWRNGFAEAAGMVDGVLLQGGATAELEAAEGAGAAIETYEAARTAMDAKQVADMIFKVADSFAEAKVLYQAIWSSVDLIPQLEVAISTGDYRLASESISAVCDQLIGQWESNGAASFTIGGQAEAAKRAPRVSARADHSAALNDLGADLHARARGEPLDPQQLEQKAATVRATAVVNRAELLKPETTIRETVHDKVRAGMYAAAAGVMKLVKNVLISTLLHLAEPKPKSPGTKDLRDWMLQKAAAAEAPLATWIDGKLTSTISSAVAWAVNKAFPAAPKDAIDAGVGRLLQALSFTLGGKYLIGSAVEGLVDDVAVILGGRPAASVTPDGAKP